MNTAINIKPDYIGHRQRILKKLYMYGYEHFADYEIVEMMLFLIFKRQDTKPLAKRLLRKFKNLNGILNADTQLLSEITGAGNAVCNGIKIINTLVKSALKSQLYSAPKIHCLNDVIAYAKIHMANLTYEEIRIICLNSTNFVIDDRVIQRGSIGHVTIHPRDVIKMCLQSGASGFILLHNHPSGDPSPSLSDQFVTYKLSEASRILDINMFDHIIISKDKYTSFRALGLLDNPNARKND